MSERLGITPLRGLSRLMQEKGLSADDLAAKIGKAPSAVRKWMYLRNIPKYEDEVKLLDVFHCSRCELRRKGIRRTKTVEKRPFARGLKNLLRQHKLTITDVAKALEVSESAVRFWEDCSHAPSPEMEVALLRFFDCSLDDLRQSTPTSPAIPATDRQLELNFNEPPNAFDSEGKHKSIPVARNTSDDNQILTVLKNIQNSLNELLAVTKTTWMTEEVIKNA